VGEVGEEEQGREADEEELRAVHGAAGNGFGCSLPCRLWSSPLSRRGGCGRGRPREEASRVALPGGLAESKPAIWVPFVSGLQRSGIFDLVVVLRPVEADGASGSACCDLARFVVSM